MFNRKKPCRTCPFRTDENGLRHIGEERAQEIADCLLGDKTFICHNDIDKDESDKQHCVGATLILEKLEMPNQMMRIAGRLGLYDPSVLSGSDEVFDDFEDWIESQTD